MGQVLLNEGVGPGPNRGCMGHEVGLHGVTATSHVQDCVVLHALLCGETISSLTLIKLAMIVFTTQYQVFTTLKMHLTLVGITPGGPCCSTSRPQPPSPLPFPGCPVSGEPVPWSYRKAPDSQGTCASDAACNAGACVYGFSWGHYYPSACLLVCCADSRSAYTDCLPSSSADSSMHGSQHRVMS